MIFRAVVRNSIVVAGVAFVLGCGGQPTATQGTGEVSSPAVDGSDAETITNSVGMRLNRIPAGTFMMGCETPIVEVAGKFEMDISQLRVEQPQHQVTLTKPFYIGVTEVTQQQWEKVMGTTPWQKDDDAVNGPDYPATHISYIAAVDFCKRLSSLEGKKYSLPTEAQWEYAMRAGTTTMFIFGDDVSQLKDYAWYDETAKSAQPVAKLKPNGFGLYDMSGNVCEWCADYYASDYFARSPKEDPTGPVLGEDRVARGGSWWLSARFCRSSYRDNSTIEKFASDFGFRVCLIAP